MSSFQNAHDFSIGTVNILQGSMTRGALGYLQAAVARGAMSSSAERCDAPKCMAETRVAVQGEIMSWILHGDRDLQPMRIMWVTGPAGTGKTAILGSVSDACHEVNALAASFFFSAFSNSPTRRSKVFFVTTLAYQLLQHGSEQFGSRLLDAIDKDPTIFDKSLKEQLEVLILKPLRDLHGDQPWTGGQEAIIIDGLDECEAEQYQDHVQNPHLTRSKDDEHVEILSLLLQAVNDPAFPFRIVIASRPERAITEFFATRGNDVTIKLMLDEKYNPDADITLFLHAKFAEIRRRYNLPPDWPSEEDIESLVENASGQFIYAATVIRFVETTSNPPPVQLDIVLELITVRSTLNPFAPLDALYGRILQTSPNVALSIHWLWVIQNHFSWRPKWAGVVREVVMVPLPAAFINMFLSSSHGEAEQLLGSLASLVNIPEHGDTVTPYKFYHKTLTDFLTSRRRGGEFALGEDNIHFYHDRYLRIVQNKGPLLRVLAEEVETFLDHFCLMYPTFHWRVSILPDNQILACDMVWWTERLLQAVAKQPGFREFDRPALLYLMLGQMHEKCRWYTGCRPHCKHWARGILDACRKNGWVVPGAVFLWFWRRFGPEMHSVFWGKRLRPPLVHTVDHEANP